MHKQRLNILTFHGIQFTKYKIYKGIWAKALATDTTKMYFACKSPHNHGKL